MKVIFKLAISQLKIHWVRTLIASCALIASISLIVVMIGGFAVTLDRATDVAKKTFGKYDLIISAQELQFGFGMRSAQNSSQARPNALSMNRFKSQGRRGGASFDQGFIKSLKSDPSVTSIFPVSEARAMARNVSEQNSFMGNMVQLAGTNSLTPPGVLSSGQWLDLNESQELKAVIDNGIANILKVDLGSNISLEAFVGSGGSNTGRFIIKVIGITNQSVTIRGLGNVYITPEIFGSITGRPYQINKIYVELKKGTEIDNFKERWQSKVASVGPSAKILTPEDIERNIADMMNIDRVGQFRTMKYVAGVLSVLAAIFIIFTTLSIGVRESSRQFAMLRAIGMTRIGVSSIIIFEGFIFALIGLFGGLIVGWLLLHWTMRMPGEMIAKNVPLDFRTIIVALASSFGSTLIATVIPIISTVRNKPLEAMLPIHFKRQKRLPWISMTIGFVLIAFAIASISSKIILGNKFLSLPFFQFDLITFPILLIGFVLIAPLMIILVEKIFAPILCLIFRLDRRLLSQQLRNNIWRTVGTAIALMVGLGLYITMQIWGRSMMVPFSLPDRAPDMIVTFVPQGISTYDADKVRNIPGVKPNEVIPMIVEQPKFTEDILAMPELKNYWMGMADNIMLFGCDVERTILNDDSMLTSKFIRGEKDTAIRKIKEGGHCIITDQLYIRAPKRFGIGNSISIALPNKEIRYTIAGIVKVDGWHWITKMSRMRKSSGRTSAIAFIPFEIAINDLQIDRPNVFWLKLEDNANKDQINARVQEIARNSIYKDTIGVPPPISGEFGAVLDINDLKKKMFTDRSKSVIWLLSRYPLYTLAIASLGIVNAIMASIWARRWEIGILRSIGLTRSQLIRLVLVEASLIGVVACVLSFVFGVIESWAGIVITGYNFGVSGDFIIPWAMLSVGIIMALVLCLIASAWPAWSTAVREPIQLLQAGRAFM